MSFSHDEVLKMQSIFKHLEPSTITSIQVFHADNKYRTCITNGVYDSRRNWIYIFQNFKNLSKFRNRILEKRKHEIPYPMHKIQLNDNIVCIGWKFKN